MLGYFVISGGRCAINIENIQKILLYITIIAGFIGPAFLIFPIGPIHIFPYRILLPLLCFVLVIQILIRGKLEHVHRSL